MITISDDEFDRAVELALAEVPAEFKPYLENVVIEVHAKPDPALLAQQELPNDILGLYVGVPLAEQSVAHSAIPPHRVLVFRDTLCQMCRTKEELADEIRITVLHEIGHHFGLDEDQLADLGYD